MIRIGNEYIDPSYVIRIRHRDDFNKNLLIIYMIDGNQITFEGTQTECEYEIRKIIDKKTKPQNKDLKNYPFQD